jgi:hypothetical protein
MSNWIKFDPVNRKTWPKLYSQHLLAIPKLSRYPYLGFLSGITDEPLDVEIYVFEVAGIKRIDMNQVIAWQKLPAMPDKKMRICYSCFIRLVLSDSVYCESCANEIIKIEIENDRHQEEYA